ncbi:MAG: biotin--[acetyl-CoA-carboxylase] ligase [Limnochordia bacterium]
MRPWDTTNAERARGEILDALRDSAEAVSGQALSRQLGIGRNSVWKHVQALRQMGYGIEGRTRQGYRLLSVPDTPYPYEITHGLETHTLGRYAIHLPVTGSTNDVLRDLAKQGAPEGLVVVADSQVSGRGRRGRVWESPVGGGLWVSVLMRPKLMTAQAPLLTLLAAVAVAMTIRKRTGLDALVKWPNDVTIGGRKVCGILVEMSAEAEVIHHLIIGIGVNVNLRREQLPEELGSSATSVLEEYGTGVSRVELLRSILHELESRYDVLLEEGPQTLLEEKRALSAVLGREIDVITDSQRLRGLAVSVEDDGALRVRLADGQEQLFYAGEVSVRG